MTPVRLEPTAPRSRVKHSTTEPLHSLQFPNDIAFLSLRVLFVLANRVDPAEMPQYVGFHQGLHCLPKYSFRSHQYTRVKGNALNLHYTNHVIT